MPVPLAPSSAGAQPPLPSSGPLAVHPDAVPPHAAAGLAAPDTAVAGQLSVLPADAPAAGTALPPPPCVSTEDTATAAASQQTEFVAMLAHELRNPLQSMAMASQLLAPAAELEPSVCRAHGVLTRQINHMSRLMDDLLDASRAASGKIVLQLAPVSLGEVIHAAVEAAQPGLDERQQTLVLELPDPGLVINGDLVRLAQVFSNLLNNASQFSEPRASIACAFTTRDNMVDVAVSDSGAGIAPELQSRVFDLFTQGHRTLERAPGGLGLGLSLVRTIAQLHGGSAAVFSAGPGLGSIFTVSLPLVPQAPTATPLVPRRDAAARNILLIEDNVDANEILAMLLELHGHRVTSSFDGIDGLRIAMSGAFDIVLCDLGLPGLTGLEVIASLKGECTGAAPLAIATTGYSDDAQRDLARAAGFDHYLVKPLDLSALYRMIADHVR
jgi:CheY-like chemotaxis protein